MTSIERAAWVTAGAALLQALLSGGALIYAVIANKRQSEHGLALVEREADSNRQLAQEQAEENRELTLDMAKASLEQRLRPIEVIIAMATIALEELAWDVQTRLDSGLSLEAAAQQVRETVKAHTVEIEAIPTRDLPAWSLIVAKRNALENLRMATAALGRLRLAQPHTPDAQRELASVADLAETGSSIREHLHKGLRDAGVKPSTELEHPSELVKQYEMMQARRASART